MAFGESARQNTISIGDGSSIVHHTVKSEILSRCPAGSPLAALVKNFSKGKAHSQWCLKERRLKTVELATYDTVCALCFFWNSSFYCFIFFSPLKSDMKGRFFFLSPAFVLPQRKRDVRVLQHVPDFV